MLNKLQLSLMPFSFAFLFSFMLLYWGQTAFFSRTKYKKLTYSIFFVCLGSLSLILLLRWIESGHFPLSNLFESLVFLSWSFLLGFMILEFGDLMSFLPNNVSGSSSEMRMTEWQKNHQNQSRISNTIISNTTEQIALQEQNDLVPLLGVMISPLAFLSYAFAFLYLPKEMQKATSLVPALQSNWLMMHVTVMICSYAALICGSVFSMAFLLIRSAAYGGSLHKLFGQDDLEEGENKEKRYLEKAIFHSREEEKVAPQNISENLVYHSNQSQWSHPNSNNMDLRDISSKLDNLSYRMCGLGFPLLTIGIISGAVWANSAWGSYWSWDPKETWALITWLVFAVYLHARIAKGWQGERAAAIATVGFFIVWFCYLGVNLWAQGLHSYGWLSSSHN